jgi:hypothetical protein
MTSEDSNKPPSAETDEERSGQQNRDSQSEGARPSEPVPSGSSSSAQDPQDAASEERLVEQTKQQIRTLVREISQLAQSDIPLNDFFEGFLGRVVSALAADGGAIWMVDDEERFELQYQIGLQKTGLVERDDHQMQHALLLKKVITSGKPLMMAPHSGSVDDEEAGNPTDYLLLLGAVKIDQNVKGAVEIFQRPGAGPATQRGYLRFLVEMCEIVSDYLKSRELRNFSDRQTLWQKLEKFISAVHASLDPKDATYTIANEARRLIECDRVSVARRHGNNYRVVAVSGSDNVDPRASTIRDLGHLATVVAKSREPTWYTGSSEDMPPQIEDALQTYIDQSHSKMIAALPLKQPEDPTPPAPGKRRSPPEVVGMLLVENIEDNRVNPSMRQRVDVVVEHSSSALANAEEHNGLFLMPVWRALGKASWVIKGRTLPKTISILIAVVMVLSSLVLIPADFDLKARGELQPEIRREVFATDNGKVEEVKVEHLSKVKKDQVLARLQNIQIDAELEALIGQRDEVRADKMSIERRLLQPQRLTQDERNRLSGELDSIEKKLASFVLQIKLYKQKQDDLVVKSPIDGLMISWKPQERLMRRSVNIGQVLMTVVDPDGEWELLLRMPESRMGYVRHEWNNLEAGDTLKASYILATDPGTHYEGTVAEIHGAADVDPEEGNTVLIRVAIQKTDLPREGLLPGTTVTAKLSCGRKCIGFVWLHDLISWVHTNILFWF